MLHDNKYPIIIGCIDHPPNADNNTTLDYISDTLLNLLQKRPSSQVIICGDFNRLPLSDLSEQAGLRNLVDFNTREGSMLDYILTDVPDYSVAEELSPLANNDYCTILLQGVKVKTNNYSRPKKRVITKGRKDALYAPVAKQDWTAMLQARDVHTKVETYHNIIDRLLQQHCPWLTNALLKTIKTRDKAHKKKSKAYKFLRAIALRRIRSSKREFVKTRLNSKQKSKEWWSTLNRITKKSFSHTTSERHMVDGKFITSAEFAAGINEYFVSVGGQPLPVNVTSPSSNNATPLQQLSVGKVKGQTRF